MPEPIPVSAHRITHIMQAASIAVPARIMVGVSIAVEAVASDIIESIALPFDERRYKLLV